MFCTHMHSARGLSGRSERYIHVTATIPWRAQSRAHEETHWTEVFPVLDCGHHSRFRCLSPTKARFTGKMPSKVEWRNEPKDTVTQRILSFCPCSTECLKGKASILVSEEASMTTLANHTHPAAGKHNYSAISFPSHIWPCPRALGIGKPFY